MARNLALLAAFGLMIALAGPGHGAPGGRLGTLPHGLYVCATPGDATGPAWNVIPGDAFIVSTASTYRTATGSGTYLLTGDRLVFTRGPLKGRRLVRTGSATLRETDGEGVPGPIRCVRDDATR